MSIELKGSETQRFTERYCRILDIQKTTTYATHYKQYCRHKHTFRNHFWNPFLLNYLTHVLCFPSFLHRTVIFNLFFKCVIVQSEITNSPLLPTNVAVPFVASPAGGAGSDRKSWRLQMKKSVRGSQPGSYLYEICILLTFSVQMTLSSEARRTVRTLNDVAVRAESLIS